MPRHFRLDFGTLGAVERTPQGGLRIPATLTRAGVFTYFGPSGKPIREYRPLSEVLKVDSLSTLKGAPIAIDHPPARIDTANFRQFATGHVGDDVRGEGHLVAASLYVQDQQAIRAIEAGRRELSCGYHCDVDETAGVVPSGEPDAGSAYDRVQRGITYNHLALVEQGRAGADVRLRLDSAGDAITNEEKRNMKIEIIGGVEYEVGSDPHRAARERRDADDRAHASELSKLRADHDKHQARADAAETNLAKVTEEVKVRLSPASMDAAVQARQSIVEKARGVLGKDFKCDGLTNGEIKRAVVSKAYPEIKIDDKSKDYVNGLYHSIAAKSSERKDGADRRDAAAEKLIRETAPFRTDGAGGTTMPTRSLAQVRADSLSEQEARSSRPLALSRRDKFKALSSHPMLQGSQLEVEK